MTTSATSPRTSTTCGCRCHSYAGGTNVSCDVGPVQPGGERACMFAADHVAPGSGSATAAGHRATTDPCPGSCNRDWFRLTPDEQADSDHPIRPVLGEPVWCQPCTRRIDRALQEFPDLYAHLEADFAARTTQPGDGGHSKRTDAPSPSPQVDEQEAVAVWLTELEDLVRAGRGFTPRRRPVLHGRPHVPIVATALTVAPSPSSRSAVRELRQAVADLEQARVLAAADDGNGAPVGSDARVSACRRAVLVALTNLRAAPTAEQQQPEPTDLTLVRITTAVELVRGSLDWLLASVWAVEKGNEILRQRGRLRAMTMSSTGAKHYGRPCPRCDLKSLRQEPAADHIECHNCGRLLTLDEYNRLGQETA